MTNNIVQTAATYYIIKNALPFIVAGVIAFGYVVSNWMDKATETEYKGTKLKITKK